MNLQVRLKLALKGDYGLFANGKLSINGDYTADELRTLAQVTEQLARSNETFVEVSYNSTWTKDDQPAMILVVPGKEPEIVGLHSVEQDVIDELFSDLFGTISLKSEDFKHRREFTVLQPESESDGSFVIAKILSNGKYDFMTTDEVELLINSLA